MQRSLLVRAVIPLVSTSIATCQLLSSPTAMDPCRSYPFDNKSFALKLDSKTYPRVAFDGLRNSKTASNVLPEGSRLFLAGVGMQKQNVLFVIPNDICLVGLHISEPLLHKAGSCLKTKGCLVDTLLNHRESENTKAPVATVAVTLKFITTVSRKQIMDLFKEALPSPGSDEAFLSMFSQFVSSFGMLRGDELTFFWYENTNTLVLRKKLLNGAQVMTVSDQSVDIDVGLLKRKLLAKLLHLSHASLASAPTGAATNPSPFSPDLMGCVRTHIDDIDIYR